MDVNVNGGCDKWCFRIQISTLFYLEAITEYQIQGTFTNHCRNQETVQVYDMELTPLSIAICDCREVPQVVVHTWLLGVALLQYAVHWQSNNKGSKTRNIFLISFSVIKALAVFSQKLVPQAAVHFVSKVLPAQAITVTKTNQSIVTPFVLLTTVSDSFVAVQFVSPDCLFVSFD